MAIKTLKRLLRVIISLNVIVGIGLSNLYVQAFTYADGTTVSTSITLSIAEGIWEQPANPWDDEWNLNLWDDEQLKTSIPAGQIFSYNSLLFIKNPNTNYTPKYHGMPGEGGNAWAIFALELEWIPNTNYRNNSVVTKDGKYYITNTSHNNNWFVAEPGTDNHWIEIEPISEEHFGYLEGTSLRDYSKPDLDRIIYK